jgi:hypothetical protein
MAASQSWRGVRMTPALLTKTREIKCRLYGTKATSGDAAVISNKEQQLSLITS